MGIDFKSFSEVSMLREVVLPKAKPDTEKRQIHVIGYGGGIIKSYPCHPSTTVISLFLKPGHGVQVQDDFEITGIRLKPDECETSGSTS
jgi:hypothetical protein